MGGIPCAIIIDGNALQGAASELITTTQASCQLVEYLLLDPDEEFDEKDGEPIAKFHLHAEEAVRELNAELDRLNHELAHKYGR